MLISTTWHHQLSQQLPFGNAHALIFHRFRDGSRSTLSRLNVCPSLIFASYRSLEWLNDEYLQCTSNGALQSALPQKSHPYKLSGPSTALPTHYRGIPSSGLTSTAPTRLCHCIKQRRYISNHPTRLTVYDNHRNVSVESSHQNTCIKIPLAVLVFRWLHDTGRFINDRWIGSDLRWARRWVRELLWSWNTAYWRGCSARVSFPPKAGNRIDSEWHPISRLCSKLTEYAQYPCPSFPPYPAIDLCICSSPATASKAYLDVTITSLK